MFHQNFRLVSGPITRFGVGKHCLAPAVQESPLEEVTPVAEALSDLSESSEVGRGFPLRLWELVVDGLVSMIESRQEVID